MSLVLFTSEGEVGGVTTGTGFPVLEGEPTIPQGALPTFGVSPIPLIPPRSDEGIKPGPGTLLEPEPVAPFIGSESVDAGGVASAGLFSGLAGSNENLLGLVVVGVVVTLIVRFVLK